MPEQNQQNGIDLASQTGQQNITNAINNLATVLSSSSNVVKCSIVLSDVWTGNDPYTQTITIPGVTITNNSKIDLQPDDLILSSLISDGVQALWIENNNGTLIAKTIGGAPDTELTIQCTIIETSAVLLADGVSF